MPTDGIIDFHAHAFPDAIAQRAIQTLEAESDGVKACHNGKVSSLLTSMDCAGIARSVICSIATKPAQFKPILEWSNQVRSERIIPLPSFHPTDPEFKEHAARIAGDGYKGVKFHPFYQDFFLAEERMLPIYEALARHDLLVVMHTGYDIAFERIRRADPAQIVEVSTRFPELKLITTHLGAWQQWDEVMEQIIGKPIYMEISFALEALGQQARQFLTKHPSTHILFGTDSPWTDQRQTLELFMNLELDPEREKAILRDNAMRLLGL